MHDGLIAAAARLVAEDAHRCELSFERVLVALKREWSRLPEARLLQITDGRDLLDRLVTESIKAYYALPVGPTGTEARAAPAGGTRERSVVVARTLLEVIHTHLPEMRGTDGVPRSDREPPCDDPSAVELEDRLMRALGSLPPDDVTALVDGLHHLHAALRAHRWPRATGRGTHGVPFHPPQH